MSAYAELTQSFRDHLAPEGPIEELCVTEIINAAWRLRRCAEAAATLDIADPKCVAIDRAQTHAHRTIERFLAELRRLQTARLVRDSVADEAGVEELPVAGIPDYRQLVRIIDATARLRTTTRRLHEVETIEKVINSVPKSEKLASFCKNIPRNAPCPCGSGEKHKRCCGKTAPPVLGKAA